MIQFPVSLSINKARADIDTDIAKDIVCLLDLEILFAIIPEKKVPNRITIQEYPNNDMLLLIDNNIGCQKLSIPEIVIYPKNRPRINRNTSLLILRKNLSDEDIILKVELTPTFDITNLSFFSCSGSDINSRANADSSIIPDAI